MRHGLRQVRLAVALLALAFAMAMPASAALAIGGQLTGGLRLAGGLHGMAAAPASLSSVSMPCHEGAENQAAQDRAAGMRGAAPAASGPHAGPSATAGGDANLSADPSADPSGAVRLHLCCALSCLLVPPLALPALAMPAPVAARLSLPPAQPLAGAVPALPERPPRPA